MMCQTRAPNKLMCVRVSMHAYKYDDIHTGLSKRIRKIALSLSPFLSLSLYIYIYIYMYIYI